MMSTSWIRQLKARFSRPAPRHVKRARARFQRLPERLERRVLPAFVITPTFDSTITSDPNAASDLAQAGARDAFPVELHRGLVEHSGVTCGSRFVC